MSRCFVFFEKNASGIQKMSESNLEKTTKQKPVMSGQKTLKSSNIKNIL